MSHSCSGPVLSLWGVISTSNQPFTPAPLCLAQFLVWDAKSLDITPGRARSPVTTSWVQVGPRGRLRGLQGEPPLPPHLLPHLGPGRRPAPQVLTVRWSLSAPCCSAWGHHVQRLTEVTESLYPEPKRPPASGLLVTVLTAVPQASQTRVYDLVPKPQGLLVTGCSALCLRDAPPPRPLPMAGPRWPACTVPTASVLGASQAAPPGAQRLLPHWRLRHPPAVSRVLGPSR